MKFKTISIIKFRVDIAWNTMLNKLPDIANDVDDLESITEIERTILPGNMTRVVNVWKSKPRLPAMVMKYINPDMLAWTDTANWKEEDKTIEWEIRSHHFHEEMHCKGTTVFETAMGGKGCRLTFSGSLEWKGKVLSLSFGILDSTIAKAVEGVLTQMIPSNFRKITEVMSKYIEKSLP
ncbi:MAG: hypothetical protein ABI416_03740 [Ginsengibacter sp.]